MALLGYLCGKAHKSSQSCSRPDEQPCSLDLAKEELRRWFIAGILLYMQAFRHIVHHAHSNSAEIPVTLAEISRRI